MRIESSVISVSWIPSEAVTGMTKLPFEVGFTHYDNPPPDEIKDLDALGAADGFRFANRLGAWIEVQDGRIIDHGYGRSGHGLHDGAARQAGDLRRCGFPRHPARPGISPSSARFVQTAGGRTRSPRHDV